MDFQKKFSDLINKLNKEFKKVVKYIAFLYTSSSFFYKFDTKEKNLKKFDEDYSFIVQCNSKDFNLFEKLLEQCNFTREEMNKYSFVIENFTTIDISPKTGISCSKCQKVLEKNQLKYYCFICDVCFCYDCTMENITLEGLEALLHKEHYMLVFTDTDQKHLLNNILRYKIGYSIYYFFEKENLEKYHNFGCDQCHQCKNGLQRYICLSCEDGLMPNGGLTDICEECFVQIYIDENQDFKGPIHKKNHVYLWMNYSGDDYYNY